MRDPGFVYEGHPWQRRDPQLTLPPMTLEIEREIHYGRLEAAKAFAAANGLNRITVPTPDAWLGIAAAGKAYYDLRQGLADLGLDDAALRRYGIRLLELGMVFPLEPSIVREFARGARGAARGRGEARLPGAAGPRRALRRRRRGRGWSASATRRAGSWCRRTASSTATRSPASSGRGWPGGSPSRRCAARLALLESVRERPIAATVGRQPYFCSGCPHNRSTVVPEGSMAAAGIGCHGLALTMGRQVFGITQMGGEGVQWVGLAPFTGTPHLFQQLGDGTLFHSGSLAIRQAVAAGTPVTFKILYNSAVAMTGGQDAAGAVPVPDLTRQLEAEGVRKILVLTDEPEKYGADARFAAGVEVWHRDRLDEAQRILRETPRRDRPGVRPALRRREAPAPQAGQAAGPGPARRHQRGGLRGVRRLRRQVELPLRPAGRDRVRAEDADPPVVLQQGLLVPPGRLSLVPHRRPAWRRRGARRAGGTASSGRCPSPSCACGRGLASTSPGIGGTGVVTVNQILGTAALLDGKSVSGLDQTGLSQKGGPVVSHLRILDQPADVAGKVGAGEADAYLGFDLLVATAPGNLARARPDRTIAVVSTSRVPTGAMVASTDVAFPDAGDLRTAIDRVTRKDENVYLDALGLAEALFGDHMAANMLVLGAAFQAGAIPLSTASIEQAIALNDVAVEMNTEAFRAGRLLVADPQWVATVEHRRAGAAAERAAC